jgi:DNA-binding transcriptional LysR family regulator
MRIRHVQFFLAVCEELNFTKAAKRIGIAQPTLSMGIKRMETKLGGELFVRCSDGVELTPLAYILLPLFEEMDKLQKRINHICHQNPDHIYRDVQQRNHNWKNQKSTRVGR